MTYIQTIAVVLGIVAFAGVAFAATVNSIQFVSTYQNGSQILTKYYDSEDKATCYVVTTTLPGTPAVSCIK